LDKSACCIDDIWEPVQVISLLFQVYIQVVKGFYVCVNALFLRVGDKHNPVNALE
jgi:hypothetical protein